MKNFEKTSILILCMFLFSCSKPMEASSEAQSLKKHNVSEEQYQNVEKNMQGIFSKYSDNATYISPKDAKNKWGASAYNANDFIHGDEKTKASMVGDFVENEVVIGKTYADLAQYVGEHDGYFFSDKIYATIFILGKPSKNGQPAKPTWQLIFLNDNEGKIAEVKIHKQ